jgi:SNF2 family DNA or RNA helicase
MLMRVLLKTICRWGKRFRDYLLHLNEAQVLKILTLLIKCCNDPFLAVEK